MNPKELQVGDIVCFNSSKFATRFEVEEILTNMIRMKDSKRGAIIGMNFFHRDWGSCMLIERLNNSLKLKRKS